MRLQEVLVFTQVRTLLVSDLTLGGSASATGAEPLAKELTWNGESS